MTTWTNDAGEVIATDTFSHLCVVCGGTKEVVEGKVQPHRCRIDLDAQKEPS